MHCNDIFDMKSTASLIKPQVEQRGSVVFSMRNKIFRCYAKAQR